MHNPKIYNICDSSNASRSTNIEQLNNISFSFSTHIRTIKMNKKLNDIEFIVVFVYAGWQQPNIVIPLILYVHRLDHDLCRREGKKRNHKHFDIKIQLILAVALIFIFAVPPNGWFNSKKFTFSCVRVSTYKIFGRFRVFSPLVNFMYFDGMAYWIFATLFIMFEYIFM